MRVHGDHWRALYQLDIDLLEVLQRSYPDGLTVCEVPCRIVSDGVEREEALVCLQRGTSKIANQAPAVSDIGCQEPSPALLPTRSP